VGGAVNSAQLLPAIRELHSRHPEYFYHQRGLARLFAASFFGAALVAAYCLEKVL
jgi:hypothetical protein